MSVPKPDILHAFDGEWSYYVPGHDEEDLFAIDDPEVLEWERLWMRPISAAQAKAEDDWGDLGNEPSVDRDPQTGRYVTRWVWLECSESNAQATPFLGVKYAPIATANSHPEPQ